MLMLKHSARLALPLLLIVSSPPEGSAQGMLSGEDATRLMVRISDLFEATRIVMPELSRAGAPLQENFRQGMKTLESSQSRGHTGVIYRMLANARAYLQLSDSLPKSPEFSEEIGTQMSDLRDGIQRLESHLLATLDARETQALGADRDNLRRYSDRNRQVGPTTTDEPRVVFLGDSITDAWRLNQYFTGRPFLNRGISGQITGQLLGRTKADVIDVDARAVVVLGGTNDLARGVPDSTIRNNLEAIGLLSEAAGIVPVMASILPVSDYHREKHPRYLRTQLRNPARIIELNRWLRALCVSRGWTYLDYFSKMVDSNGRLEEALSDDGLHPNAEGYKVMAPLVLDAIDAALQPTVRRTRPRGR